MLKLIFVLALCLLGYASEVDDHYNLDEVAVGGEYLTAKSRKIIDEEIGDKNHVPSGVKKILVVMVEAVDSKFPYTETQLKEHLFEHKVYSGPTPWYNAKKQKKKGGKKKGKKNKKRSEEESQVNFEDDEESQVNFEDEDEEFEETVSAPYKETFSEYSYPLDDQIKACSGGKMTIEPWSGSLRMALKKKTKVIKVEGGVMKISFPSWYKIKGKDKDRVQTDIKYMMKKRFGITNKDSKGIDFLMINMPFGTVHKDKGVYWGGNANFKSIYSFFNADRIFAEYVLVHEFGHNLNLKHANEDGITYGDNTSVMGSSKIGKRCFNAAKNVQLGWFSDRTIQWNGKYQDYSLIGVADYKKLMKRGPLKVIVKLDSENFVSFNRVDGITAGSAEKKDQVVIHRQTGGGFSHLLKGLKAGETYTDWKNGWEVAFVETENRKIGGKSALVAEIDVRKIKRASSLAASFIDVAATMPVRYALALVGFATILYFVFQQAFTQKYKTIASGAHDSV